MIDMIESIMKGENQYPEALKLSKVFWDKFFEKHADDDEASLQKAIDESQTDFQWAVEKAGLKPPFAKSILVLTCIASLYNDGFENPEFAKRVLKAVKTSTTLSIEVKGSAKHVEAFYSLG